MLLRRLVEYGGREPSGVPPRYKGTAVKYAAYLRGDGSLIQIGELSDGDVAGKKNRGKQLTVPNVSRTAGVRANLLVDNAEYALGVARKDKEGKEANPAKVAERRRAFVEQVRDCAEQTSEPAVACVLQFLETLEPGALPLPEEFDATANVAFVVVDPGEDEVWPAELPAVQRYWATRGDDDVPAAGERFDCLVCGTRGRVLRTLDFKVKGIPGGQASGTALVSFNAPAFTSYGLEQTENAPICETCGEGFSKALNTLIADPATHYRSDMVQYVFWTREPVQMNWGGFVANPNPAEVRALMESVRSGRGGATALDETPFYALALSASGGRAVVRDWLETTVGNAKASLARYFALQDVVEWDGQPGAPLAVFRLARATRRIPRGQNDDPSPNTAKALLRVAFGGGALPRSLLYEAVQRNRAEGRVLRDRVVLIKMALMSDEDEQKGEGWMTSLTIENTEPAYLCGRLLAVLDTIQRQAIPGVNASIVDRYYGTASSAPMTVFGTLLSGAQAHLAKLRRDRPGAHVALDGRLQQIMRPLGEFPAVLTLKEQGLFALGFYHQRADDAQARRERRQGARAAAGASPDPEPAAGDVDEPDMTTDDE